MAAKTHIWWSCNKIISTCKVNGSGQTAIYDTGQTTTSDLGVDPTNGHVYYASGSGLYRVNTDGTGYVALLVYAPCLGSLTVDFVNGHIYYGCERYLKRCDLDASNDTALVTRASTSWALMRIALDLSAGKMYWTERYVGAPKWARVYRADLDGSNEEVLVEDTPPPVTPQFGGIRIDVAGGKIYWTNPLTSLICRANLDGTGAETIIDCTAERATWATDVLDLDLVTGKLFYSVWTTVGTGEIRSANLDGSSPSTILSTTTYLRGITLTEASAAAARWDPRIYPLARTTRRAR